MKKMVLVVFGAFALSTSAQAAFYDFTTEGNTVEAGYETFTTGVDDHIGMASGLTIIAGVGDVPNGEISAAYAYMDGSTGGRAASGGLGVCGNLRLNETCDPNADDNQNSSEIIGMFFDVGSETRSLGLTLTGDHAPVVDGTTFHWSTDFSGGPSGEMGSFDISGAHLTLFTIALSDLTDSFFYWITDGNSGPGQIYLSSLTTGAVPVPAAVWLFGTAIAGLFGLRRKTRMEAVAA